MKEIILETLIDGVKMLPFLFFAYLFIEYIEHKSTQKFKLALAASGKYGILGGAVLGCVPQCGFSVTAANLYSSGIITMGTLIAVFLSTSDEAIPVILSHPEARGILLELILIKVIIAIIAGFTIDFIRRHKHSINEKETKEKIKDLCTDCDCGKGIFRSALHHTISIFIFILIVSFLINVAIMVLSPEALSKLLLNGSIFQPIIAAIIGLIPNCASSVLIMELYISGNISFGSVIAGLCSGAGVGLAVLLKVNRDKKDSITIIGLLFLIGSVVGIILQLF